MLRHMQVIPLTTDRVTPNPQISLRDFVALAMNRSQQKLRSGDIVVLSSKIVSYFEGNLVKLSDVKVSQKAKKYARKMNANPALIQLAVNEADEVIALTPWVLLTRKNGVYSANAGVDLSNVPKEYAITWPKDPFASAKKIRKELMSQYRLRKFAVLIIDSLCIPGRKGTIATAIGISGIKGYQDLKGARDLYGNILRYSALNIVDSLATSANLLMGESAESTPLAIIRGYDWKSFQNNKKDEMLISSSDEMFPI